jgi:capsular exopolysaccharide synthesis family protein
MIDASPLERYLVPLRRWWPVLALVVALGLTVTWLTLPGPPGEPSAEEIADPSTGFRATQILLRNADSPTASNFDLVQLLATQGGLANRVAERMDGQITTADVEAVVLESDGGTGTLTVTSIQPSPDLAVELTATYVDELIELLRERDQQSGEEALERATDRVAALAARIETTEAHANDLPEGSLDRRLLEADLEALIAQHAAQQSELRAVTDQQAGTVEPFETIQEPSPVSALAEEEATLELPRDSRARFALVTVLALLLGFGAVLAIDYLDTRVRTRQDAEDAFGLPVIAEFPRRSARQRSHHPVPAMTEPDGAAAEALRSLRLSVVVAPMWRLSGKAPAGTRTIGSVAAVEEHEPPRSLLVTSALTGEGKTTIVANLAASFAEAGQRVLVVDCDFRRPAAAAILGVEPAEGLHDIRDPYEEPLKDLVVSTAIPHVDLVPAGRPGIAPPWFLGHSRSIVEQSLELADVVLFDSGPLLLTNEASALIPSVETSLVVVRSGRVNTAQARDTVERLTRVSANVAGIVLIGPSVRRRYGYYQTTRATTGREEPAYDDPASATRP